MFNEVLAVIVRLNLSPLLRAINACIRLETFPKEWKTARIILLHKGPAKPVDHPSSYRPIFLLNGAGKIFKHLLLNRMASGISSGLLPNQFEFRPSIGTTNAMEAILAIVADVAKGVV